MNYILNIHTTTEQAIINICNEKEVIATDINTDSKEHAKFLHIAIQKILKKSQLQINDLKAIGVTNGPGSYTGIRVGLATAKGLCFSLKIPLITCNTLEVMTLSAIKNTREEDALFCPMIDARRMEVFTAVYTADLGELIPPSAIILDEKSFDSLLPGQPVYCFGSGSKKFENISNKNALFKFINQDITSDSLGFLSREKYEKKIFDNVAFAEPLYIKDFHSTIKK